jgi:hypothetical protein
MKFSSYFSGRLWQETPQPQTSIFDAIEWRGARWPPAHGTQDNKGKDTSSVEHLPPPPGAISGLQKPVGIRPTTREEMIFHDAVTNEIVFGVASNNLPASLRSTLRPTEQNILPIFSSHFRLDLTLIERSGRACDGGSRNTKDFEART